MEFEPRITKAVNRFSHSPLFIEVATPKREAHEERFSQHAAGLQEWKEHVDITGINLPEIQDESQKGDRGQRRNEFKNRIQPRAYAQTLRDVLGSRFIINRVIVKHPPERQEEWMLNTFHEYGLDTVVLVGGESSTADYPGPSVTDGNEMVRRYLNHGEHRYNPGNGTAPTDLLIGNISIPTRRRKDFDEPERMFRKIQTGADFFTTQIIAEPNSPVKLMEDLSQLLLLEDTTPPMILWSFSPISSKKDVDFLRWLGVYIPDSVEERILTADDPAAESTEWIRKIWTRLLETNRELPVPFPMGCNISVMGMRNFENAMQTAKRIQSVNTPETHVH